MPSFVRTRVQVALKNKVNMKDCLSYIHDAREKGLTAPVVLMGYLNPFLAYGLDDLMKEANEAGRRFLRRAEGEGRCDVYCNVLWKACSKSVKDWLAWFKSMIGFGVSRVV